MRAIESRPTDQEAFGGAGAGLAAGMLIGALLGPTVCDPEPAADRAPTDP
jgi:hypothetical protein